MARAKNLAWLRQTGRRYIIGAPKSELKKFAAEIMEPHGWRENQEGVEVKLARHPKQVRKPVNSLDTDPKGPRH